MDPNTHQKKTLRYETIDIAKAFAIILVVVGHFQSPYMPHGYEIMRSVIYLFHMPLFVFVSGFLYIATWRPTSYKHFVVKKFKRLMIPYLFVSIIIIGLKLLTPGAMTVENPVTCHAFLEIFYSPAAGFFLWFIWALWWMMLIIPLFHTPASRFWLFILSIHIHFYSHLLHETF